MTEDERLDRIYRWGNELMSAGFFDEVDAELETLVHLVDGMTITEMIAYLSITTAGADKLPHRAVYFDAVRARLTSIDPARVERLLSGLHVQSSDIETGGSKSDGQ